MIELYECSNMAYFHIDTYRCRLLRDLNEAQGAGGVHPGGLVDGVAPDVEHGLGGANYTRNQRADADS